MRIQCNVKPYLKQMNSNQLHFLTWNKLYAMTCFEVAPHCVHFLLFLFPFNFIPFFPKIVQRNEHVRRFYPMKKTKSFSLTISMVCFSFIQHALRSFMIFCNFSWIKIPPHNLNKIILCISSLENRGDCSKVSIFRKLLICVLFFSEWSWMQVFNAVNRFVIFTGLGYGK